ncbi:MAG: acyl-ACP thioesterase domain-containing protein [Spirochaetota bacterium]
MNRGAREFEVMFYDTGVDSKATVRSLYNYMQAAADEHSRSLGTSLNDFADKNLTWVYSRYYTEIFALPRIYDRIVCETWRSGYTGSFVKREFNISGSNGEKLVAAVASLALIDMKKRKPVEIPDYLKEQLEPAGGEAIAYNFPPIEKIENYDYIYDLKVRHEDIDINRHMNNASYAQILFESIIDRFENSYELKSMDINFKGEAFAGDMLECMVKKTGSGIFLHKIINRDDKRVILNAKSLWKESG